MLREEDVFTWMIVIAPIVVIVSVLAFIKFVRWGERDLEKNRLRDKEE